MYYNYFRDYDPKIGRYIEADPIGLAGSLNLFTYVSNNSTNWIDILGLTRRCPRIVPMNDNNWREYYGNSLWFHCGFQCFHETREPCPDDPIAEWRYDDNGILVGPDHEFSGCKGTPNQYPSSDWFNHIFNDSGGILENGWDAYNESWRYYNEKKAKERKEEIRRQQEQIHEHIRQHLNK